jgi:uncharacterized protein YhbP (UPF0306 family)
MTRDEILRFMRSHSLAVEATVSETGAPQAAVVGIVVTEDFELFFDTLDSTRKAMNLRQHPKVAFVIGGPHPGAEKTVQYEGLVDEPMGVELEGLKQLYFDRFIDGPSRQAWKGIIYVRVRPIWLRYSDFSVDPPRIVELDAEQLKTLK